MRAGMEVKGERLKVVILEGCVRVSGLCRVVVRVVWVVAEEEWRGNRVDGRPD